MSRRTAFSRFRGCQHARSIQTSALSIGFLIAPSHCAITAFAPIHNRNPECFGVAMLHFSTAVLLSAFTIGSAFGVAGLLSGFCLTSGLRNWATQGDGRMIRTFALAAGMAVISSQLLAAFGLVDLSKSIYLQPSFSAPLILFGGLIFGYARR
jgi:hypothetical protein